MEDVILSGEVYELLLVLYFPLGWWSLIILTPGALYGGLLFPNSTEWEIFIHKSMCSNLVPN